MTLIKKKSWLYCISSSSISVNKVEQEILTTEVTEKIAGYTKKK